jgi:hypothetical protein
MSRVLGIYTGAFSSREAVFGAKYSPKNLILSHINYTMNNNKNEG